MKGSATGIKRVIAGAAFLFMISAFGLCQEGDFTGPNFSGEYVLIRTTGALRGAAPKQLYIVQTENLLRVGTANDDRVTKWTRIPLKTDWVDDDKNGKVKAFFSQGALIVERAIDLRRGYYRQMDEWTVLGEQTMKLCRHAYARMPFGKEVEKSGCAEYSNQ